MLFLFRVFLLFLMAYVGAASVARDARLLAHRIRADTDLALHGGALVYGLLRWCQSYFMALPGQLGYSSACFFSIRNYFAEHLRLYDLVSMAMLCCRGAMLGGTEGKNSCCWPLRDKLFL